MAPRKRQKTDAEYDAEHDANLLDARHDPLCWANFRYWQPYVAEYLISRREVVFHNREYSRLGSFRLDEAKTVAPWGGAEMYIWGNSGKLGAPHEQQFWSCTKRTLARRQKSRDELDALLRQHFAGYTVLFEADDPHCVVPSALVGLVSTRVMARVESSAKTLIDRRADIQIKRWAAL